MMSSHICKKIMSSKTPILIIWNQSISIRKFEIAHKQVGVCLISLQICAHPSVLHYEVVKKIPTCHIFSCICAITCISALKKIFPIMSLEKSSSLFTPEISKTILNDKTSQELQMLSRSLSEVLVDREPSKKCPKEHS